ncbi:hypothetical protein [Microvirga guangxiensis]|uniref:Membrane-anchored ribosome-binding protein, inhibits growth in stationary phase, ElaB/YqjD/DUF883 family n=1 Tax=Microvirga guangxiensis TaxID=549386 RepID=A0A1G5HUD7_9HYPH|nr:hypothetical protein [Microvirga guangxiensis]SCY67373.1 hypothetical protein SAMN02927923_01916 [Microvirga guangxiensis]
MSGSSQLHRELAALHAELSKSSSAGAKPQESAETEAANGPAQSPGAYFDQQLNELSKALSDYTGTAEDLIAEHPLASVLGAFVVGLALGRMVGRA